MAIYFGDQQNANSAVVSGGTIEVANAATLDAISGEAPTYVFSAFFEIFYNGQTLTFRPLVPYSIDAALLAVLNANSAPITAA